VTRDVTEGRESEEALQPPVPGRCNSHQNNKELETSAAGSERECSRTCWGSHCERDLSGGSVSLPRVQGGTALMWGA
jgi:hypothetical protein